MNQQDGGRGTGYLGTGVYFYTAEHIRGGLDKSDDPAKAAYRIPCACKNPLETGGEDDQSDFFAFHDFSRNMVWLTRDITENRWGDKIRLSCPNVLVNAVRYRMEREQLERPLQSEEDYEPIDWERMDSMAYGECNAMAQIAVERTKNCLLNEGYWSPTCTQPINHLLTELGFDCVWPGGEWGQRNDYGAVILREAIEKRGITRRGEYVPNPVHGADIDNKAFEREFGLERIA